MNFADTAIKRVVYLLPAMVDESILVLGHAAMALLCLVRWCWYVVTGVGRLESECALWRAVAERVGVT